MESIDYDRQYLDILLNRIRTCKMYRPKFGLGQHTEGLSLMEFQALYRADPFYSWFGLDHPLMYAAHRAAGGITSIYRQIGIACEELFRQILQDHLGLKDTQVIWSYTIRAEGRWRKLSLDGRIEVVDIRNLAKRRQIMDWLALASNRLEVSASVAYVLRGAVFEVRQGYKSKDSKRQNADIANAAAAYAQGYLPVIMVLSTQIDSGIAERYENEKWLVLRGEIGSSPVYSTYAFVADVVGYDLAAFFARHTGILHSVVQQTLEILLSWEVDDS